MPFKKMGIKKWKPKKLPLHTKCWFYLISGAVPNQFTGERYDMLFLYTLFYKQHFYKQHQTETGKNAGKN